MGKVSGRDMGGRDVQERWTGETCGRDMWERWTTRGLQVKCLGKVCGISLGGRDGIKMDGIDG